MALRLAHMALTDIKADRDPGRKRHYLDVVDLERGCWNGKTALVEEALDDPLHWQKPRSAFTVSMGDLFHDDVHWSTIATIFDLMARTPKHTYLVLTKRPALMQAFLAWYTPNSGVTSYRWPFENVWIGTTVEDQEQADKRIPLLQGSPAAVRFVSIEPMLGPIDLHTAVDWVIVGGESGPGARPMYPKWVRGIRDQCQAAGTPWFFKQWGSAKPDVLAVPAWERAGRDLDEPKGGHILDGQTHHEWPEV
jgi:protein gp37